MIRSTEMQPDVLVIGGGLIGLLTAAELAERGARVSVLEKDDVGFEQSGRSVAAINLPGGKPNSASSLLRVSAEEWSRFEERWGYGIDLNAEGWLIVVADEADPRVARGRTSDMAGDCRLPGQRVARQHSCSRAIPAVRGCLRGDRRTPRRSRRRADGHECAPANCRAAWNQAPMRRDRDRFRHQRRTYYQRGNHERARSPRNGGCGRRTLVAQSMRSARFRIPMQRVRAPAVETGPMPPGTIPGFVRGSTFGAKRNHNGTIRITGGYRFSAMLHDLSLRDFRDLRVWVPALWQKPQGRLIQG